jgi:hypothetical protein
MGSKFRKSTVRIVFTPEQVSEMQRLYWSEGETLNFLAKKFGVSISKIQRVFKENGIPIRPSLSVERKITKDISKEQRKEEAKKVKRRIVGVNI